MSSLEAAGSFAYDSEFIGESSYHPRLCLIQVATTAEIWLLDPMADLDLTPFWELLCNENVVKIVHAGAQDIEPVVRFLGRGPTNIFDTQIASGFIGRAYPTSLSKLVLELTGVVLPKGLTFTAWDARPLSSKQLRYAADDVRYLPHVHQFLSGRLEATGLTAWCKAECDALCEPEQYRFNPIQAYERVRGAGGLPPRQLAIVRELTVWRDGAAREADLPARSYLKDEVLVDLARSPVKTVDQLDRVRNLPRPVQQRYGGAIVAALQRGQTAALDGLAMTKGIEPSPTERFRADVLWAAAQTICLSKSIDPALVTSRQEIGDAFRVLSAGKEISALGLMRGWRKQALGDELEKFVNDGQTVSLKW